MLGNLTDKTNKLRYSLWLIASPKGDGFSASRAALRDPHRHGGNNIPSSPVLFALFQAIRSHARENGRRRPSRGRWIPRPSSKES
jgi:hypothetical protein